MNKNIRQKFIISAALMIAATASAFAQGNGSAGHQRSYFYGHQLL